LAAFNMSSRHMKIVMMFRRRTTPAKPIVNSRPLTRR
jgi:hypothetical protein